MPVIAADADTLRIRSGESLISFETHEHATLSSRKYPRTLPYNSNPIDFAFWQWVSFVHAELLPLGALDFDDFRQVARGERWIAKSLRRVAVRIGQESVLTARFPYRPFYIGISTAKDWYEVAVVLS